MRRAAETDAGIQMVVTTGDNFYMFAPHPPLPSVRIARLGASLRNSGLRGGVRPMLSRKSVILSDGSPFLSWW
jgi:hypothetical protein